MATRYTATIDGRETASGGAGRWRVEIDDPGYAGSPVALTAQAGTLTWGEQGRDLLDPLMPSRLSVRLLVPASEDIPAALAGADPGTWQVRLMRHDGSDFVLFWSGVVAQDLMSRPLDRDPYELELEAIDGLGLLEDPYADALGLPPSGQASLIEMLAEALAPIGTGLPFRVLASWTPGGADGSSLDMVAGREALREQRGTSRQSLSRIDVCREIVRRVGARLLQYGGAWYVVQRELMRLTGQVTIWLYDTGGAGAGTQQVTPQASLPGIRLEGAVETWRPPVALARVRYAHGEPPDMVRNGEFVNPYGFVGGVEFGAEQEPPISEVWSIPTPSCRTLFAGTGLVTLRDGSTLPVNNVAVEIDALFHGSTTDPAQVRAFLAAQTDRRVEQVTASEVLSGQQILFSGRVILRYNEGEGKGLFMTYFSLAIQGTDYYLRRDGSWGQSADEADRIQPIMDEGGEWGKTGLYLVRGDPRDYTDGDWTQVQIYSEPAPASGPLLLRLYGSSDRQGSKLDVKSAIWDSLSIRVVDAAGQVYGETTMAAWRDGATGGRVPDEVTMRLGQGPVPALPGALHWQGSMVSSLRREGSAEDLPVDQLWLETVLRMQARPLRVRRERRIAAGAGTPLEVPPQLGAYDGGDVYSVEYLSRDLVTGVNELELVELRLDNITYSIGSGSGAGAEGGRGGSSAASAAGSGVATVNDLTPAYLSAPFAVVAQALAAGQITALPVTAVGYPGPVVPVSGYIRIIIPETDTAVDAYVVSGTQTELQVRDPVLVTQPLTLPEDVPEGAPVWLSARYVLSSIAGKVTNVLTGKGDLIVGGSGGVPLRLPPGTDGQILAADSGEPGGLKWINFSGGGGQELFLLVPDLNLDVQYTGIAFLGEPITLDVILVDESLLS
ncbi:MAG: hypothetical protein KatS3mg051_1586 [Anaerolineae bacterium]|nr:MAG: hypothetical protein KatS3mg051_1586 [Anaerolineae bacterium]